MFGHKRQLPGKSHKISIVPPYLIIIWNRVGWRDKIRMWLHVGLGYTHKTVDKQFSWLCNACRTWAVETLVHSVPCLLQLANEQPEVVWLCYCLTGEGRLDLRHISKPRTVQSPVVYDRSLFADPRCVYGFTWALNISLLFHWSVFISNGEHTQCKSQRCTFQTQSS